MSSDSIMLYWITIILTVLIEDSAAATFMFTYQQATYIVAAVAAVYVVLCVVFLYILCRVSNRCKCCHKGKVCPTMQTTPAGASLGVKYHGGDFIEIEKYSRKRSVSAATDKSNSKLESIPEGGEDGIIANFAALEDESLRSKASKGSKFSSIHRGGGLDTKSSVSTSTAMTSLDDDSLFSKVPSPSSTTGTASLAEFFEMKAKEESPLAMMSDKLASETGVYELLGMEHGKSSDDKDYGESQQQKQAVMKDQWQKAAVSDNRSPTQSPSNDNMAETNMNEELKEPPMTEVTTTSKDLFTDEFQTRHHDDYHPPSSTVFVNPALVSHSAHSITSSPPITVPLEPLPPIRVKKMDHANISLSSHKLNRIKGSESPDTRSLPDRTRMSPYNQRVKQTDRQYTPTGKKKPALRPVESPLKKLAAAEPHSKEKLEASIQDRTQGDKSNGSPLLSRAMKSTLAEQKSQVCVVEEADSTNELTMI